MKTSILQSFFLGIFLAFSSVAMATHFTIDFVTPSANQHVPAGTDLYVKVNATATPGGVKYVKLYINNQFVGTEHSAPYEWGKPHAYNQHLLNNLQPGTYYIKAEVHSPYGARASKTITIYVDHYNNAPQVKFEKPYHGQRFPQGSNIGVQVKATDYDDYVAYVKLYINGHYVGQENHAPYQWGKPYYHNQGLLNNLAPGTYHLKAVAYDNYGKKGEKTITIYVDRHNNAPHVSFDKPYHGQRFHAGSDIGVQVRATDFDDYVAYVKLYINGHYVGQENHAPYQWGKPYYNNQHLLNNLAPGTYHLKAVAYDNYGKKGEKTITIYVDHYNNAPVVNFIKPYHGQRFPYGSDIGVQVTATDHDDYVAYVKLYINGHLVSQESHAPYQWGRPYYHNQHLLNNLPAGTYHLKAVAYDNYGKKGEKTITIYVDPKVCTYNAWFTHPLDQSNYYEGEAIEVGMDATGYHDIEKIALYYDGHLIAEDYNFPYHWGANYTPLSHLTVGTHIIKAVIYDKCGYKVEKYITIYVDPVCDDLLYIDFEHYPLGDIVYNDGWYKLTNTHSGKVVHWNGSKVLKLDGHYSPESALLQLGHLTTGTYTFEWDLFVPKHNTAGFNFYSTANQHGHVTQLANILYENNHYNNKWVKVECTFDLDNDYLIVYIDGVEVINKYVPDYPLGFISFQTIHGYHSLFYVDNFYLKDAYCNVVCKDLYNVSFEGYDTGTKVVDNYQWIKLNNTQSGYITEKEGNKYLKLDNSNGEQSALLDIGELKTGKYEVNWKIHVPSYKNAECNFYSAKGQNGQIYKLAGINYENNNYGDKWVQVESVVDLDNNHISVKLDGAEVLNQHIQDLSLGYMSFQTIVGQHCEFYIDDIIVKDPYCDYKDNGGHTNYFKAEDKTVDLKTYSTVEFMDKPSAGVQVGELKKATDKLTTPNEVTSEITLTNTPNPFIDRTEIIFNLPKDMDLTIGVFNTNGQMVRQFDGNYQAGRNNIEFTADDLPAGMYIVKMQGEALTATHKMIIGK